MYKIVSKLLMYGDMPKDSILMQLSDIFKQMDQDTQSRDELVTRIFTQVKHLLQVATDFGFDKNLWHNYLTYLLITDENPFSLTCEKVGANDGSVNFFAKGDFKAFKALFDFDFSEIEERLGIDCFTRLSQYKAIGKKELIVATAEGALSLKQVQPAGKPKMDIASFLNGVGRSLAVGERFGD